MDIRLFSKWAKQADRFESLGDNCEFGFVNRNCGFEYGSLFRWASIKPESLLALLLNDFRQMYEFSNLEPLRLAMVNETIYNIGWHTEMKSLYEGGKLVFLHEEKTRKEIFKRENKKINYLVNKFKSRLRAGGCIYFIKANNGIAPEILDGINARLALLAGDAPFWLVQVRVALRDEEAGTVSIRGGNVIEALVSRFASYERADDVDMPIWAVILDRVFDLAPFSLWEDSKANSARMIEKYSKTLNFPLKMTAGTAVEPRNLDFGTVSLVNDHPWSRLLDSNVFRLHTTGGGGEAASIVWSSVTLEGRSVITVNASASISESKPVKITLSVKAASGSTMIKEEGLITSDTAFSIEILLEKNTYQLQLTASIDEKLKDGEKAVIDIDPVEIALVAR